MNQTRPLKKQHLYSTRNAAVAFGIDEAKILSATSSCKLKSFKVGSTVMVGHRAVSEWLGKERPPVMANRPVIKATDALHFGPGVILEVGEDLPRAVLNDKEIQGLCDTEGTTPMVYPFEQAQVKHHARGDGGMVKVISYGTSSFGYDARIGNEVKIFTEPTGAVDDPDDDIDPSDMQRTVLSTALPIYAHPRDPRSGRAFVRLPPHASALAHTVERFKIPRDVIAICLGKSTYARAGIIVNVTPLEPGWEGVVTLEIVNTTPRPVRLWVGEGICQFVFLTGNPPSTSYADRNGGTGGKYQGQQGITLPRA